MSYIEIAIDNLILINGIPGVIIEGQEYYIKISVKGGFYIDCANNRDKREWVFIRN